jgi:hypothetical protein
MKLKPVGDGKGNIVGYAFHCPGCDHAHIYYTAGPMTWSFNGDFERPTFAPSLLNTCPNHPDPKQRLCHLNLTGGILHYDGQNAHDLKGQSVPIPDWPYGPDFKTGA